MKLQPKTDEELERASLIEPGTYDFEVLTAEDTVSKKGNDMIKLKLRVFLDGYERTIYDYILDAMPFKVKHFCRTTGLIGLYNRGSIYAADCVGRTGKCEIDIQSRDGYPLKNTIEDYVLALPGQKLPEPTSLQDDDIPF